MLPKFRKLFAIGSALAMATAPVGTVVLAQDTVADTTDQTGEREPYSITAYDFFASHNTADGDAACKVLKETYPQYVFDGDRYDATNLYNMLVSLKIIEDSNEIRREDGLKEFRVTDQMMASSQVRANWSEKNYLVNGTTVHAPLKYSGDGWAFWGENLDSYGDPRVPMVKGEGTYRIPRNSLDAWYYEEKQLYLAGRPDEAGHYRNLIRPESTLSGAAFVYSPNRSGNTNLQTFLTPADGTQGYSVSEYRQDLEAFMRQHNIPLNRYETVEKVAMYRVYNPNSGEHFYTSDENEKNHLTALGWKDEGLGWNAPEESNTPVYRLYNINSGDHHYTTNREERDNLITIGWSYEGIGWYSDDEKEVPLYRSYNPNATTGSHHYTKDKDEHNYLISVGWSDEGIAWYSMK